MLVGTRRLLFWTSVGRRQQIESSLLDGTSRRTLVSAGLSSLSSLTVDSDTRRVFWADAGRRRVEWADYDGSERRGVVAVAEGRMQVPAAVAVLGRHVYWIDDGAGTVERADKETGGEREVVKTRLTQLTDVLAVVRATDDGRCVNSVSAAASCGRLRCSHLCVVDAAAAEARCSCPPGMSLGADALTCARDTVPDCGAEQVRCGDAGPCVRRCDGVADCADRVDEAGCYGSCRSAASEFQCLTGATRCVPSSARCDGRADCDDASDEARCARCRRSAGALLCRADGRCVGAGSVCDGRRDCSDGEDERHCSASSPGPRHVLVAGVCVLLMVALAALSGALWRRRRAVGRRKSLRDSGTLPLPFVSSRHAMIAAATTSPCRGGLAYDRVPPGGSTSSSAGSSSTSVSSVPLHHYYPPLNPPPSLCTGTSTAGYSYSYSSYVAVTPCSTDVCDDDLDSAAALAETQPLYRPPPPPPTPNSRCASSLGWTTGDEIVL